MSREISSAAQGRQLQGRSPARIVRDTVIGILVLIVLPDLLGYVTNPDRKLEKHAGYSLRIVRDDPDYFNAVCLVGPGCDKTTALSVLREVIRERSGNRHGEVEVAVRTPVKPHLWAWLQHPHTLWSTDHETHRLARGMFRLGTMQVWSYSGTSSAVWEPIRKP